MDITITPGGLAGTVTPPPSKSQAHRLLIAAALAYFLFAASQGFHGVYPYHGVWTRALTP